MHQNLTPEAHLGRTRPNQAYSKSFLTFRSHSDAKLIQQLWRAVPDGRGGLFELTAVPTAWPRWPRPPWWPQPARIMDRQVEADRQAGLDVS